MTLDCLKTLIAEGKFHHATYRDHGTIWEGLWIYGKADAGFRGYIPVGSFEKGKPSDEAHELVKAYGVSVGAFGEG